MPGRNLDQLMGIAEQIANASHFCEGYRISVSAGEGGNQAIDNLQFHLIAGRLDRNTGQRLQSPALMAGIAESSRAPAIHAQAG